MPDCVVEQAKRQLACQGLTMAGTKCGVLGMAYKLRRLLIMEGAEVLCTDVYIKREDFVDLKTLLEQSQIILVGCPHREYKDIKLRDGQHIIDCWGSLAQPSIPLHCGTKPTKVEQD